MEEDTMMALLDPFTSVLLGITSLGHDFQRFLDRNKEKNLLSDFQRIELTGTDTNKVHIYDIKQTSKQLVEALNLRQKYMSLSCQRFPDTTSKFLQKDLTTKGSTEYEFFEMKNGVVFLYKNEENQPLESLYPDIASFIKDHTTMFKLLNDGPLRSFCSTRLCFLSTKFNMHILVNSLKEAAAQKTLSQIDFNRVIKIDTHVHASGCIHPTDLLQFIENKLKDKKAVYKNEEDDTEQTLKQVLEEYDLKDGSLNEDTMDVNADRHTFRRFDIFNAKYNPFGQSKLREIFFKTDNYINGQYFAEILKVAIKRQSQFEKVEYRLSIYGQNDDEWKKLAQWAEDNKMNSGHVQWIIQVPRIYHINKKHAKNPEYNFEKMLRNIFVPLFKITQEPGSDKVLQSFLKHVSGFDSVDDESKSENITFTAESPTPDMWTKDENPPYTYYLYYMYANIAVLNKFRRQKGMGIFAFRPHCGEAGNAAHLIAGFLFAESISHGLMLHEVPVLEYLFYLSQIGIAMSPTSNNALFVANQFNPFPEYFSRGLNISLSTDDPMQFHRTKEPLIEEYSTAAKTWNLSSCDICEIARNSDRQSGFPDKKKSVWHGFGHTREGVEGNDASKTNVPSIRVAYRYETLMNELTSIKRGCQRLETSDSTHYKLKSSRLAENCGDVARLCFAAVDVKFVDTKTNEEGPLELDVYGTKLTETLVIDRFLATQFGLFGSNCMERAQIDEIITKISDFTKTAVDETEVKRILIYLEKKFKENPIDSGFIVGAKLSVADLTIVSVIVRFIQKLRKQTNTSTYPWIKQLEEKVCAIRSIGKYMNK